MSHALLSPSSASRWLSCTPSARLEATFPESTSSFAEEGTLAHSLGEILIAYKLGDIPEYILKDQLLFVERNEFYSETMYEYCDEYATFVVEQYNTTLAHTPDAQIFLERRLNMTDYVPDGFGTGDVIIVADTKAKLIDLKYGKGVTVSAIDNKQLKLYALGVLREFDFLYDIETIEVTIYQPRIDNISSWEITTADLMDWAKDELKPKAALAFEGKGEFVPGNHCQFCKAKGCCKALAEQNLEIAKYEFTDAVLLSDEDTVDILNRYDMFVNWINAVEEYALQQAINGKKWPGYKLVEGRSNRKYLDEKIVADKLLNAGFAEDVLFEKKLLGITKMQSELTKKVFDKYLSDLVIKPQGKATLVPSTDKRPEFNSVDSAVADFA